MASGRRGVADRGSSPDSRLWPSVSSGTAWLSFFHSSGPASLCLMSSLIVALLRAFVRPSGTAIRGDRGADGRRGRGPPRVRAAVPPAGGPRLDRLAPGRGHDHPRVRPDPDEPEAPC